MCQQTTNTRRHGQYHVYSMYSAFTAEVLEAVYVNAIQKCFKNGILIAPFSNGFPPFKSNPIKEGSLVINFKFYKHKSETNKLLF